MPDAQPEKPAPADESKVDLRRFREYVAAGIALVIIVGSVAMLLLAFTNLESPEAISRAKDLLLVVNPLLGVVIGYYFNKVSTEARAESAEMTASTASATAQQATEARDFAEAEAQAAQEEAQEAKTVLTDMTVASGKMLDQLPARSPGVLGGGDEPVDETRQELRDAWVRARRLLGT